MRTVMRRPATESYTDGQTKVKARKGAGSGESGRVSHSGFTAAETRPRTRRCRVHTAGIPSVIDEAESMLSCSINLSAGESSKWTECAFLDSCPSSWAVRGQRYSLNARGLLIPQHTLSLMGLDADPMQAVCKSLIPVDQKSKEKNDDRVGAGW